MLESGVLMVHALDIIVVHNLFTCVILLCLWERDLWHHSQVVKSVMIVINMVLTQILLAPFCCVFGKDTLQHFFLLDGLSKQF